MNEPWLHDDEVNRQNSFAHEIRAQRELAARIYKCQTDILDQALRAVDASSKLLEVITAVLRGNAVALKAYALSFWRHDSEAEEMVLQMMFGYDTFYDDDEKLARLGLPRRIPVSHCPTWPELQKTLAPFPVYDIAADARVTHPTQILAHGTQTMLVVPLLSNNKLIGWSSVFHFSPFSYDADYIDLARALAQQATFVVELVRLAERGRAEKREIRQPDRPLTTMEMKVLKKLEQFKGDKEIAKELGIALSTATSHVANVRDKLKVQKRDEAVAKAREMGLLKPL